MSTCENARNVEPIQRRTSRRPKNGRAALREGLAFRIGAQPPIGENRIQTPIFCFFQQKDLIRLKGVGFWLKYRISNITSAPLVMALRRLGTRPLAGKCLAQRTCTRYFRLK